MASDNPTQESGTLPDPAPVARRGRGSRPSKAERLATAPRKSEALQKQKAEERAARQEMILLKTICGQKAQQIAQELQVSVGMVRSDLAAARRADMLLAARDRIQGLVPKAIAALEAHLEDGDKDVALLVLEGLGVIGKHVQVSMMPPAGPGEESFEVFRARVVRSKSAGNSGSDQGSYERAAAVAGSIIDAEVTEERGQAVGQALLAEPSIRVGDRGER